MSSSPSSRLEEESSSSSLQMASGIHHQKLTRFSHRRPMREENLPSSINNAEEEDDDDVPQTIFQSHFISIQMDKPASVIDSSFLPENSAIEEDCDDSFLLPQDPSNGASKRDKKYEESRSTLK
jgi:hypothetical protein